MAPCAPLGRGSAVVPLRPLLGIAKARLVATLRTRGLSWVEDPSNEQAAFERVRLRRASAVLAELGLENERIALSAARLRRARTALAAATASSWRGGRSARRRLRQHRSAAVRRRARGTAPAPPRCLVAATGGAAPRPRLSELEHLLERLAGGGTRGVTLGGCIVAASARDLDLPRAGAGRHRRDCPATRGGGRLGRPFPRRPVGPRRDRSRRSRPGERRHREPRARHRAVRASRRAPPRRCLLSGVAESWWRCRIFRHGARTRRARRRRRGRLSRCGPPDLRGRRAGKRGRKRAGVN